MSNCRVNWPGISKPGLRIIVLRAASNALEDLLPLVPSTLATMAEMKPGQLVRVDA